MKNRSFKIVVPFYNVENWIHKCVQSIRLQTYKNFVCYLIDDLSTDNTVNKILPLIEEDNRFVLIRNKEKKYALQNICDAIVESGNDAEDIIVTLDGDDWFATKKSLEILNQKYNTYNCWITYGSYVEYPSMQKGKFCKPIDSNIIKNNSYREASWVSSHLRTFKRSLWDKIDKKDLLDNDEKFYRMTWDMAFMFPMLEMAGPLALHVPEVLYTYNRQNPLNDDKVDHDLQLRTETEIRNKNKYEQFFVSCNIRGPGPANSGLGNQLFCIANALSYAKDNDKIAFFPGLDTEVDLQKYKNIFYKKLKIGKNINIYDSVHTETSYEYSRIPNLSGNVFLDGYFQSAKYFEHNRDFILEELNIPELKSMVSGKYGDFSSHTSVHVRRGDYLKLKDYHGLLDTEYYKKATSLFDKDENFIVFSDDIEWCKDNLTFLNNVTYFRCKEDWEDMVLMATCKNNIIANSTFSWWSAWISGNKTIAPKKWFSLEDNSLSSRDICPVEWRRI